MSFRMPTTCLTMLALALWVGRAHSDETIPLANALATEQRGNIQVRVDRTRNIQGQVCMSLFSTSQGFPAEARTATSTICIKAAELQTGSVAFNDLPWGTYAVALFHDENFDKKLNFGIFGIPTEGFGFSNNPGLRIGAPAFQECAFTLSEEEQNIVIDLRYLL